MNLKIKCPKCNNNFTIEVLAIDKYRKLSETLKAENEYLKNRLKEIEALNSLKNMFGME